MILKLVNPSPTSHIKVRYEVSADNGINWRDDGNTLIVPPGTRFCVHIVHGARRVEFLEHTT